MTTLRNLSPVLLWAPGLLLLINQSAFAARLLNVTVEKDGVVVVYTFYEDNGRADAATIWRYLQDRPIMVDDDVTTLEGDADNPLRVTLEGDLLVRIGHGNGVIAQARLGSLTMQRTDEQSQEWFLSTVEVERTAGISGLGPPAGTTPAEALLVGFPMVAGALALALVGVLVVACLALRRKTGIDAEL